MILNQSCRTLIALNYFFNVALIEDTGKFTIASDYLFKLQSCVEFLLYDMHVWTSKPHNKKYFLLHKSQALVCLENINENSVKISEPLFQKKQTFSGMVFSFVYSTINMYIHIKCTCQWKSYSYSTHLVFWNFILLHCIMTHIFK